MTIPVELKAQLLHTWPVFFASYGNFTPAQVQAIPPILAGRHTLVMAATAAGKTEAAIAPLLERHLAASEHARESQPALRLLYIAPTRALVRDLYERLALSLEALGVSLAMKSGDTGPVSAANPPTVLITTPESTDSLLTRNPRLFIPVRAVVLDEIHLFDNTPRGDHLRCLLRRIEIIQRYHSQQNGQEETPFQRVALSATVPDPAGVAVRYLTPMGADADAAALVEAPGGRQLAATIRPLYGLDDLVAALVERAGDGAAIRKSLIFCNTRNEVEQVAAYLRQHLPYAAAIFVHYSNLDPALRREVEDGFAAASVALCVSTSTLELGIDIGTIDEVVLVGAPPTLGAFWQRAGRGGRRSDLMQVLCLARSALELLQFEALADLAGQGVAVMRHLRTFAPNYAVLPSVLVQQTFSLLKQSPTAGVRLADLRALAPVEIHDEDLRELVAELVATHFLQTGRPGEWRAGPALNELVDAHEIYSNIGGEARRVLVVDAFSGRTIAQTGRIRLQGETLLMGGRALRVVWRDAYRIGVEAGKWVAVEEDVRWRVGPFAAPLEVSQMVRAHLGIAPGTLHLVSEPDALWLFHFWGDLYGDLLAALLQDYWQGSDEGEPVMAQNAHCLRLPTALVALPPWPGGIERQVQQLLPRLEATLELGRFHPLLPAALAERTILARCDLPRFAQLYQAATLVTPVAGLRTRLLELVG